MVILFTSAVSQSNAFGLQRISNLGNSRSSPEILNTDKIHIRRQIIKRTKVLMLDVWKICCID